MKGQLLLFVMLLLFSSPLFGVDENHTNNSDSRFGFLQGGICDDPNGSISPTSSPAIIPDLPRVLGEQNNSDQSKKIKASFSEIPGFVFLDVQYPIFWKNWTDSPIVTKSLFILFHNLRI